MTHLFFAQSPKKLQKLLCLFKIKFKDNEKVEETLTKPYDDLQGLPCHILSIRFTNELTLYFHLFIYLFTHFYVAN